MCLCGAKLVGAAYDEGRESLAYTSTVVIGLLAVSSQCPDLKLIAERRCWHVSLIVHIAACRPNPACSRLDRAADWQRLRAYENRQETRGTRTHHILISIKIFLNFETEPQPLLATLAPACRSLYHGADWGP